jgi:hypothetical protein
MVNATKKRHFFNLKTVIITVFCRIILQKLDRPIVGRVKGFWPKDLEPINLTRIFFCS